MAERTFDPYAGNILMQALGPILSPKEAYRRLSFIPKMPPNPGQIPKHIREHLLMSLWDLHLPREDGLHIQATADRMLRKGYQYRDPSAAQTWARIARDPLSIPPSRAPAMAAVAVGHSGTGKTQAIQRALNCYPHQVFRHETFPQLVGPHLQVVWLSVDVPESGRSADLATNLMVAWDNAMARFNRDLPPRFAATLGRKSPKARRMLDEWLSVALSHWLGVLHLDEVQNFFRALPLRQRRGRGGEPAELSIAEAECLNWIVTLLNTWQIPVFLSGTPRGVSELSRNLSTLERTTSCGYHVIKSFENPHSDDFNEFFFSELVRYQFVQHPIQNSAPLRELVLRLTAGIPRIIIALWIAAHRVAFKRKDDSLRLADFESAANTLLAPLSPAVAALLSGDRNRMSKYEDLLPHDDFWASFWTPR